MALLSCTIDELLNGLRAAGTAEALLCETERHRRYQFDETRGVSFASFKDGMGDHVFVLASADGAVVKGFDYESDISRYRNGDHGPWPGMFDGCPEPLLRLLDDPTVRKDDVTFLYWRGVGDTAWQSGPVTFPGDEKDGSEWLVSCLPVTADQYVESARDYFEEDFDKVPEADIRALFG